MEQIERPAVGRELLFALGRIDLLQGRFRGVPGFFVFCAPCRRLVQCRPCGIAFEAGREGCRGGARMLGRDRREFLRQRRFPCGEFFCHGVRNVDECGKEAHPARLVRCFAVRPDVRVGGHRIEDVRRPEGRNGARVPGPSENFRAFGRRHRDLARRDGLVSRKDVLKNVGPVPRATRLFEHLGISRLARAVHSEHGYEISFGEIQAGVLPDGVDSDHLVQLPDPERLLRPRFGEQIRRGLFELRRRTVGFGHGEIGEFANSRFVGKAASEDAAKAFAGSALDGIGSESWRLLWEQARKFSDGEAYPGKPFPVVGENSLCVLCHQPLDHEARKRVSAFESFVKGGLEAAASAAEKAHKEAVAALPAHFDRKTWDHNMEFLKVGTEGSATAYEMAAARLKALPGAASVDGVPAVDFAAIDAAILEKSESLGKESAALAELRKEGKKEELEKALKELKARHWLSVQKEAAAAEIARLGKVRAVEKAEGLTKTNAITLKKNELAKDELAAGYRDRFVAELKALGGGRLKVEPVPVTEGKGKISFKLSIKGAAVPAVAKAVLSEGENRVVALAAFLADITGSGLPTPFVFDDPVSSLDQEFEERVVERLLALAKTRQVIVFTHRLSLLALLEDAVEAEMRVAAAGATTTSLSVVTLRRIGDSTGSTDELDVRHKKPKSGCAVLRDQKLPQIRKLAEQGSAAEYDSAVKSLCGDFRILVERSIEKVMLGGLMERFRRSVQTKQIKSLAKINVADCALIDEMMTKYSKFEHSQPDEIATPLPTPDEIAEDIGKLVAWMDEFSARVA